MIEQIKIYRVDKDIKDSIDLCIKMSKLGNIKYAEDYIYIEEEINIKCELNELCSKFRKKHPMTVREELILRIKRLRRLWQLKSK